MLERVSFWCDEIRRTRRGYVLDWWGRPVACCILRSIVGGGLVAVMVVREGREGVIDISRGPGEGGRYHILLLPCYYCFPWQLVTGPGPMSPRTGYNRWPEEEEEGMLLHILTLASFMCCCDGDRVYSITCYHSPSVWIIFRARISPLHQSVEKPSLEKRAGYLTVTFQTKGGGGR